MAKFYPVTRTRTRTIIVNVSDSEVTTEMLRYDVPETHSVPTDAAAIVIDAQEQSPPPIEDGVLAILLEAMESHATPLTAVTIEAQVLDETSPAPSEMAAVVADVQESHSVPTDEIQGVVLVLDEAQPAAQEDVSGTAADFTVPESSPASSEIVGIEADVQESTPVMVDVTSIDTDIQEQSAAAVEDVTGTQAIVVSDDVVAASTEVISLSAEVLAETLAVPTHADFVQASGNLWPDTAVTTTGFTTPANAVDKNEGTAALCTASSSGLINTTSNTTNGTLVISAPNPLLSDLTSITSAIIRLSTTAANSGSLSGQAINMALQYSTNDGGAWTTIATVSTFEGNQVRTLDVTAVIGNDWAKVNGFRLRATGTVTSGIGVTVIPGVSTFSFFYGRLELVASRTY